MRFTLSCIVMSKAIELGARAAIGLGSIAYQMYKARAASSAPVRKGMRKPARPRQYVPRNVKSLDWVSIRRTSTISPYALATGFDAQVFDVKLNQVFTSDLIASYDCYRIRKVVVSIQPRVDAGNSGITNNNVLHVWMACDQTGDSTAPTAAINVGEYANHKYSTIPSGQRFYYTFYPKAINTVDNNGTATNVGSYGMNPWINLNTSGVNIPHKRLLWYIASSGGTSTTPYDLTYQIYFDVKRFK